MIPWLALIVLIFPASRRPAAASTENLTFVARVARALELARIPPKAAALLLQMDAAQFSRTIAGGGHFTGAELERLPAPFHQWYAVALAEEYGVPRCLARGAVLAFSAVRRLAKRKGVRDAVA